ncbi:MAG: hypothetical protein QW548_03530 [Candidatus Aenigmatarchaeota archaeon]
MPESPGQKARDVTLADECPYKGLHAHKGKCPDLGKYAECRNGPECPYLSRRANVPEVDLQFGFGP